MNRDWHILLTLTLFLLIRRVFLRIVLHLNLDMHLRIYSEIQKVVSFIFFRQCIIWREISGTLYL